MSADEQAVQKIQHEVETVLTQAFPGTHFQVEVSPEPMPRGCPYLIIHWCDGPSEDRVAEICAPFDPDCSGRYDRPVKTRRAKRPKQMPVSIKFQRRYTDRFYRPAVDAETTRRGVAFLQVRTSDGFATLHLSGTDFAPERLVEFYAVKQYIRREVSADA